MTTLFLSYSRGDDEPFVKRLHKDLIDHGFDVWFDRVSMPSRRLTFHQEIRDAIAARDRLLLVVGPHAAGSDYVRQEWQFAWFEADKVVTPILRLGDYPLVPDELKLLHCEDFRDDAQYTFHLDQLVRILGEPPPPLAKLIAVPSLPAHFLSRSEILTKLRDTLRADLDRPVVISGAAGTVGLHGMGGIGKSVLAAALARDRKVREAFSDGIVWIGLGSLPDLRVRMQDVHRALGGDGAIATEHEGKEKLKDLLKDKAVLLVIDDVWRRGDVDAFDVLGARCRVLITSRDAGLLTSLGGTHHVVELLTDDEALHLLAVAAGIESDALPGEAHEVLAECGRLPLAVALAGGMIRAGTPWGDVRDALREHELEFLKDPHAANEHHVNLWRMIEVSVRALTSDVQQRLAELAVFPDDEQVPEAAVCTLWQHTGNLNPRQSRKLLVELKQRSLVQLAGSSEIAANSVGKVSLHDLVHDYCVRLAQQQFGDEAALHTRLLDAYRQTCPDGWWTGPNHGYFLDHLRNHLVRAVRGSEMTDLLLELRWLEAKNAAGLVFDLLCDFSAAIGSLLEEDDRRRILQLLEESLRRDIHFIDRHRRDYPQGLFQCMWNCCWWYDCNEAATHYLERQAPSQGSDLSLYQLLERWRLQKEGIMPGFIWLRSIRPPKVQLGSPLKMILRGHESSVHSVAFSHDNKWIASGSRDGWIRIWDTQQGNVIRSLMADKGWVLDIAVSPNCQRVAAGGTEGIVRIFDTTNGDLELCLTGHQGWVRSVAFSPDNQRIVSASDDQTVRMWDANNGNQIFAIAIEKRGQSINSVAFHRDGSLIVGGSNDYTLRIWDAIRGIERMCLKGHEWHVDSVAFSTDGRKVASASWDRTVRVWELDTGSQLFCLEGHRNEVRCVSFSPDGRLIVSGSDDLTVRVWDAVEGTQIHCWAHDDNVQSVAFSPDGQLIASGTDDDSVCLWDLGRRSQLFHLLGHADSLKYEDLVVYVWFLPDGRLGSSSLRETCFWDANTGECLEVINRRTIPNQSSESDQHPLLASVRELDTVITFSDTDKVIAISPHILLGMTPHPSGRIWAGSRNSYLGLFALEGIVSGLRTQDQDTHNEE